MEYRGSVELAATPEAIWAAMIDPAVLVQIIPYAEKVEQLTDSDYAIHVAYKIIKLKVALKVDDSNPPVSWRLKSKANQILIGAITAAADVQQERTATGTRLSYVAAGNLPPRLLAMLGEGFHQKVREAIEAFFKRLETQIGVV